MAVTATAQGFVQTPAWLVDEMVAALFASRKPTADDVLVDPGCGNGDFIAGVLRFCKMTGLSLPKVFGIELDRERYEETAITFREEPRVTILHDDFLKSKTLLKADFIIGNPPYVSLTNIAQDDRALFRRAFTSAQGRFDLYMLFFDRALQLLNTDGILSYVTPEKWMYVKSAERLRALLACQHIESLKFVAEDAFTGFVTYPLITQVLKSHVEGRTLVKRRDGQ